MKDNIKLLSDFETLKGIVSEIRKYKQENHMAKHEKVDIDVIQGTDGVIPEYNSILYKLCNVENINIINK